MSRSVDRLSIYGFSSKYLTIDAQQTIYGGEVPEQDTARIREVEFAYALSSKDILLFWDGLAMADHRTPALPLLAEVSLEKLVTCAQLVDMLHHMSLLRFFHVPSANAIQEALLKLEVESGIIKTKIYTPTNSDCFFKKHVVYSYLSYCFVRVRFLLACVLCLCR